MDEPELCFTGVRVFDQLDPKTKLAMLAFVAIALRDEQGACPELTALSEGTFAAVYGVIRQWIELEIDMGRGDPSTVSDENSMRQLVLAALSEARTQCEDQFPSVGSDQDVREEYTPLLLGPDAEDIGDWGDVLDELMDQVLWGDRDFDDADMMLDVDPDLGHGLKAHVGIDEDYFTGVAPEPSAHELTLIRETLRKLCGRSER